MKGGQYSSISLKNSVLSLFYYCFLACLIGGKIKRKLLFSRGGIIMFQDLKNIVVNSFDKASTSVEGIHKSLASLPLDIMAKLGAFEDTANSIKKIQEDSISKVYAMTRNANQQIGEYADNIIEKFEKKEKKGSKAKAKKADLPSQNNDKN